VAVKAEEQFQRAVAAARHAKATLDAESELLAADIGPDRAVMSMLVAAAVLAHKHGYSRADLERWVGYAMQVFDAKAGP
jgi:hypothetical protein